MLWCLPISAVSKSHLLRLVALTISYAVSLLIFQRGLLVKRQVLLHRSSCLNDSDSQQHCWVPPRYNKAILLIVDALRFDFIYSGNQTNVDDQSIYYLGQMPSVTKLIRENPSKVGLLNFVADAPTTTFQRIKALVTGTVPAFIEISDNFGATEVSEDNVVDQLIARKGNITLLGDDTWLQLLPGRFRRHFAEPSFDIKDLDTVDNTVIAHIYSEITRTDWTLMIAHCLGVDHAGHRYGPIHPEMTRKLHQMDHLIWNLTQQMPDDAILFVFGDHGMTMTGDHGGDSEDECNSALFVYSKQKEIGVAFNESNIQIVNQVDLVPTLSLLLDIPIPYSNIGMVIESIFGDNLLSEIRLNSFQLLRYVQDYVRSQPHLQDKLRQIIRRHESSPDDFLSNANTIKALQRLIRHSLDEQSNVELCLIGIVSLFEAVLFNAFLLLNDVEEWLSPRLWIFRSALLLLQLSFLSAKVPSNDTLLFSFASLTLSFCYQIMVISYNIFAGYSVDRSLSFPLCFVLIAQIVFSLLPLSNSFIIYESDVMRFILQTVICGLTLRRIREKRYSLLCFRDLSHEFACVIVFLISARCLKQFEICREEQVDCSPPQLDSAHLFLLCLFSSFGLIWFLLRQMQLSKMASILCRAFAQPMALLLCAHWLFELTIQSLATKHTTDSIQQQPKGEVPDDGAKQTIEFVSRTLAQFVYLGFISYNFLFRLFFRTQRDQFNSTCWIHSQFILLCLPLMMLAGYRNGFQMAILAYMFGVTTILTSEDHNPSPHHRFLWPFLLHIIASFGFYATGHQQTLSSIPWHSAFVGLPGNFPFKWVPASLVLVNLFSGRVLASLIALQREAQGRTTEAPYCLLLFGGLRVIGSSLASLVHQRHLMFFKIFAPKFIFESIDCLFCCIISVLWSLARAK